MEHSQDAITEEEMSGTAVPSQDIQHGIPKQNNACTIL